MFFEDLFLKGSVCLVLFSCVTLLFMVGRSITAVDYVDFHAIHLYCIALAYTVLYPLGLISFSIFKMPRALDIHEKSTQLANVLVIIGSATMTIGKIMKGKPHLKSSHAFLGGLSFIAIILQSLGGYILRHKRHEISAVIIRRISFIHKCIGPIIYGLMGYVMYLGAQKFFTTHPINETNPEYAIQVQIATILPVVTIAIHFIFLNVFRFTRVYSNTKRTNSWRRL